MEATGGGEREVFGALLIVLGGRWRQGRGRAPIPIL